MNEKIKKALVRWWERLTLPQVVACAAGVAGIYLMRDQFPTDVEGWKQWGRVLGYVLAGIATAGTLTNGKEGES